MPADVRDGLHPDGGRMRLQQRRSPTVSSGVVTTPSQDGNMYQPVIHPATVTTSGNGTYGYGPTQARAAYRPRS